MFRNHVTAIILIATCYGCDWSKTDQDPEKGPPPEVWVKSAIDLGILETVSSITMRDGGYSAVFDGRSVWLYGDTFLNIANADNNTLLSNTWSWTSDVDASDGIRGFQERVDYAGAPETLFSLTDEEHTFNELHKGENCTAAPCNARWAIWPGAIVVDPETDWAYVFYGKVYAEPGDFNFNTVGHSISVWKNFNESPQRPLFNRVDKYPTLLFGENEPAFGSAALIVDAMLYVYGCDIDGTVKPCRLARVPVGEALDPAAWTYYSGDDNWSPDLKNATAIFNGNDIMSVFYNTYSQRYLAIFSQPLEAQTRLRTAPSPAGPWSRPVKVFDAIPPNNANGWVYDALAHPEFTQNNSPMLYITYSRQTAFLRSEVRLVAVELELPPGERQ